MGKERECERIELKSIEWKAADDGTGELVGYASVFENGTDVYGDIISHGAFTKTIKERVATGMVPLTDSHSTDCKSIIGKITAAIEDDHGLLIRARFAADQHSQDCRQKALDGFINGLSIGYWTIKERFETVDNETVRRIDEVKLVEIALTALPAREDARLIGVKKQTANGATAGAGDTTSEAEAGRDATTGETRIAEKRLRLAELETSYLNRRFQHEPAHHGVAG